MWRMLRQGEFVQLRFYDMDKCFDICKIKYQFPHCPPGCHLMMEGWYDNMTCGQYYGNASLIIIISD